MAQGRPEDVRRRTDTGHFGDKVSFPDPTAAPLGTDDEAAGTPSPAGSEAPVVVDRPNDTDERQRARWERPERDWLNGPLWALLAVLVVAGIVLAAI